eukprot:scaffold78367_cov63-Attheya_sp.AAC.2
MVKMHRSNNDQGGRRRSGRLEAMAVAGEGNVACGAARKGSSCATHAVLVALSIIMHSTENKPSLCSCVVLVEQGGGKIQLKMMSAIDTQWA